MAEMIIVKSKIRDVAQGCNVAGDFPQALNEMTVQCIQWAVKRADGNGRKTVQAKDTFIGKLTAKEMLVSKSRVKEAVGGQHNVAGDFAEALNESVTWMVEQAAGRAEANGRKTISAKDL